MRKTRKATRRPLLNVLLSVYDKTGIEDTARRLVALKRYRVKLWSSGGTAKKIKAAGIPVTDVAKLVGGKAILEHRVVTLSRELHAGLLADRIDAHLAELKALGLPLIDVVMVDMYPLKEEISKSGSTRQSVIEKTDVGGPTMIRSGAKGGRLVACTLKDRQLVIERLEKNTVDEEFRQYLRGRAEFAVADYVLASAIYHGDGLYDGAIGTRIEELCYGESRRQTAAYYGVGSPHPLAPERFTRLTGMAPSYIGFTDMFSRLLATITKIDAAWRANSAKLGVKPDPYIAVGVKHGNACGAGVSYKSRVDAIRKMIDGDRLAIHGGVVMLTFPVGKVEVEALLTHGLPEGQRRLLDGIVAPAFKPGAVKSLKRKGDKCRLYANPNLDNKKFVLPMDTTPVRRQVFGGGWLTQSADTFVLTWDRKRLMVGPDLTVQQKLDLLLAWAIGSTSNSNTITIVKDGQLLGNAVCQQDRVGAATLALWRARRAGHNVTGAAVYSDSFFPFPDGLEVLIAAEIGSVFTSSGSVNDDKVFATIEGSGITLVAMADAEVRGFYGH